MKISERLHTVTRLFLDTAPVIYYVEDEPRYAPLVEYVFERLETGSLLATVSPVTLAECLVIPYRLNQLQLLQTFVNLLAAGDNTALVAIDQEAALKAAELRARYNLSLTDAFQVAVAMNVGCDAFLTNDAALGRVTELPMIVLDEMENG